jgi:hypothetical protein
MFWFCGVAQFNEIISFAADDGVPGIAEPSPARLVIVRRNADLGNEKWPARGSGTEIQEADGTEVVRDRLQHDLVSARLLSASRPPKTPLPA